MKAQSRVLAVVASLLVALACVLLARRSKPVTHETPEVRQAGAAPSSGRQELPEPMARPVTPEASSLPSAQGTPFHSPDDLPDTDSYRFPPSADSVRIRALELEEAAQREHSMLLSFLSPSQTAAVLNAVADIDAKLRDIDLAHADGRALESDVSEERIRLRSDRSNAIREVLSPTEWLAWVGHLSDEAGTVAQAIPDADPAIRAQVAVAEWQYARALEPEVADIAQAELRRATALRQILTEEGYRDYERRRDTTYSGEEAFGADQQLVPADTANLYDWRNYVDKEEQRLIQAGAPDAERLSALRSLVARAREAIESGLGTDRFVAYEASAASLWLKRFDPEEE